MEKRISYTLQRCPCSNTAQHIRDQAPPAIQPWATPSNQVPPARDPAEIF